MRYMLRLSAKHKKLDKVVAIVIVVIVVATVVVVVVPVLGLAVKPVNFLMF